MTINDLWKRAFNGFKTSMTYLTGMISWKVGPQRALTQEELDIIRKLLKDNYLIILTRHPGHFSTFAQHVAHLVLTGRWGHYSHAVLNVEDEVNKDSDYDFLEATATKGVHHSTFAEVFDDQCTSVCLLKPKHVSFEEWLAIVERSKSDLGKPYDVALDITQSDRLNCIELVRDALKGNPNYATDFAALEAMIQKYHKNLDPQMAYECPDFEIIYEIRK